MRHLSVLILLWTATSCFAQKAESWLPITPQDAQLKSVPGLPVATAIQLYYSYNKDDNDSFLTVYRRIKVLREAGRKYADVEIEVEPDSYLKDLAARTVHPDGTTVEFKDKPFDKTIIKGRGVKFAAKTFTLPDVSVGSIIEYKYTLGLPLHRVHTITTWELQSDLFTLQEDFRFRAYQGVVYMPVEWRSIDNSGYSQVVFAYLHQLDTRIPEKKKGNVVEFHAENISPFISEDSMPPEDDFKPVIFFYYGGHEVASPDKYWETVGKTGATSTEKFIGNFQPIRDLAAQVIGNETDPEKKLRKLYARAQQIRNTSFERERSEEEKKQEKLKDNQNVSEVLSRGHGTSYEISALFAAPARAAGFEANMLFVADRRYRSFQRLVLSLQQIDSVAVQVKIDGKDLVLVPGTPYCPFGLLPWEHSSVTALKFSKVGAEFITTPVAETSPTHRSARMSLSSEGALTGEINVELKGQDALEHRLEALKSDEAGRRKQWEEELQQLLPQGAVVKLKDSQGWDSTDEPLSAHFDVQIPNFAATTGKRLIAPALLFGSFQKDLFSRDARIYPIILSYPFVETDEVDIKFPQGYTLEAPPFNRTAGLHYAGYETASSTENGQLITRRSLRLDQALFAPEQFPELKNFFDVVRRGDEGQLVLAVAEAANADKKQ